MTNDSKNSKGWRTWVMWICAAISVYMCWWGWGLKQEIANRDAKDSILFKDARALYIQHIASEDSLKEALNKSEGLRASETVYHEQREKAYQAENTRLRRELAEVNTSTATTMELDSIHLALFGPAPDDSLHTIALEYSRQLTGDALRLPIVESMLTNTETQLSDAQAHYGRMEASYKLDIHDLKEYADGAHDTIDSMYQITGKMQGMIDSQERKFKRQRRRERILEGLAVAGVIILVIL